ncbi:MAG: uroporphyrinogen-III synthase [Hyphomicrobiaceae bacterium]
MRLWITRPEQDAGVLRAKLVAQGHEVVIESLLHIDFDDADPIELDDVQALIATSRNGVRAAAASDIADLARHLPLFAVGPGTASTAEALGFAHVIQGPSTAEHLLPVIVERTDVNAGALLHLAGGRLAFEIGAELQAYGYHVLQPTVYTARTARQLSVKLLQRIANAEVDGVILLSPRTAKTYVELAAAHQIERSARRMLHYCLSPAVARQLSPLQPEAVRISSRPNIAELLALTDPTAAKIE